MSFLVRPASPRSVLQKALAHSYTTGAIHEPEPNTHFKITLRRSAIALGERKKETLTALGLHRRMQTVYHEHTPEAAGKILKVKELLEVENVPASAVIYHLEERRDNTGSCAIVKTLTKEDILPKYSARDSVNDYGGAPAIVYGDIVYFSNEADNRIYAINVNDKAGAPEAVTPENPYMRYANFAIHPKATHLLVTIREDHTNDREGKTPQNVVYTLCTVDTKNHTVGVLTHGTNFYASPVFNSLGDKIAWQEWYLPDMPWEGGIIYVADVTTSGGTFGISNHVRVAGEKQKVSATFPSWISDTTLLYTSDEVNKFQKPYIFDTHTQTSKHVLKEPQDRNRDFAEPAWWLGLYPYAILGGGKYGAFTAFEDGRNILFVIDLGGSSEPFRIKNFDFAVAQHLRPVGTNTFVFKGSNSSFSGGIILGTIGGSSGEYTAEFNVLPRCAEPLPLDKYISMPINKELTADNHNIYVVYYSPYNPEYSGSSIPGEKPPCIINVHGGPTGLETQGLNWTKMFYTSRGFTWLDVNYRGSSGYGREYIQLLNGNWGIYDVEDCKRAHKILADESLIGAKRVAHPSYYKTACAAFGCVADPTYLTEVIEKLESQYMYRLFGSLPDEGAWDSRNPIKHIKEKTGYVNFSVPLLMLHGEKDGVIPLKVVQTFLEKITEDAPLMKGKVDHKFYPGEGHHFHQTKHIQDALKLEHAWYTTHLLK